MSDSLYGLMAEFSEPEKLVEAARLAYAEGYRRMDGYSPIPVEGLSEALGLGTPPIPAIVFVGGLFGALAGYLMQYCAAVVSYPLISGGRPFHSWPAFIPVTFEMTILFGAFGAVGSLFILNRLPEPYHPVFNVPQFERASQDRFFLCIESADPQFQLEKTRGFLEKISGGVVHEVAP